MRLSLIFFVLLVLSSFTFSNRLAEIYSYEVGQFQDIQLQIPADVEWTSDAKASCVLTCAPELEKKIEIEVSNEIIRIKSKERNWNWGNWGGKENRIKIQLKSLRLKNVAIHGSGDVVLKSSNNAPTFSFVINGSGDLNAKIDAQSVEGSINGSGDVKLSGQSSKLQFHINGSGDVQAEQLECKEVVVRIAGSGNATVFAQEALDVKISGSGDVKYKGNPAKMINKVSGSGELRKL